MTRFPQRAALPLTLLPATLLFLTGCAPGGGKAQTTKTTVKTTGNDLDAPPPKTTALAVRTLTTRTGSLNVVRTATATLQAERDSNVAAQTGGTVTAVLTQEGKRAGAGQVVVRLDDTSARQALENARLQVQQAQISLQQTQTNTAQGTASLQAGVQAAEAGLAKARQDAASAEQLYGLGGISQADLNASRSALAQAQSTLAQAQNTLTQNGRGGQSSSVALLQAQLSTAQAGVRQAEENLNRTQVRAPFAGLVASLPVEVGEFVNQGGTVFRLVDERRLRARFTVPPAEARVLRPGTKLNLSYGGANYVATVEGASGVAGADRLVPVEARVEGGGQLPVGGTAQIRYRAALGRGVLVPTSAISVEGGENAVYLAEDGVARRVTVRVVAESGGQVAVQGLEEGVRVISPVPPSLQDGAGIRAGAQLGEGSGQAAP